MKIITNYNELKIGDVVAVEYEYVDCLFNTVGEVSAVEIDSISINAGGDWQHYGFGDNTNVWRKIKTLALLCPVDEKLHLGDVWEKENGENFLIGAYFSGNTWEAYQRGHIEAYLSKTELEARGYKLRTTPREVTMDEVREKFGEDIIIKK